MTAHSMGSVLSPSHRSSRGDGKRSVGLDMGVGIIEKFLSIVGTASRIVMALQKRPLRRREK